MAAPKAENCERIYREQASGGRWDRPELQRLLDQLCEGDVLVVWKLDRLSRSLRDVLTIMERLAEAKAGFRSLTDAIDTTTPAGRMMMQVVGSFADYAECTIMPSGNPKLVLWRALHGCGACITPGRAPKDSSVLPEAGGSRQRALPASTTPVGLAGNDLRRLVPLSPMQNACISRRRTPILCGVPSR
jgi:Resolvase, N terminal domain